MIQLWHPRLAMYNLCLDRDDASWYHRFLSALSDATHGRGGKLMGNVSPPAPSPSSTRIIRSI